MSREPARIVAGDMNDHPAVSAWQSLAIPGGAQTPSRIEVIREKAEWLTCALVGAGPGGTVVIAKRRSPSSATVERTVYERVLPKLPVSAPHWYGCVDTEPFIWFFLAAVDGDRYSESDRAHVAAAGRAVGLLHTAGATLTDAQGLPDAGPTRYLGHLVRGRHALRSILSQWRTEDQSRQALIEIIERLDEIERRWALVHAQCEDAPHTLVHGDFRPKNVYVGRDGLSVVILDWETAGWGPPCADLTRIDIAAYGATVRSTWKHVTPVTLARWAELGDLFQALAAIEWDGEKLAFDTPETLPRSVAGLAGFSERLARFASST